MGLQYNILWVDDRVEEYKILEINNEIESYIREQFFEPHIYMYEIVEEAEKELKSRKYDVIFSDFNISENKSGEDFINYIRKQNVNTEVLFYSAKQDLPIISLDRISFLNLKRDASYDELKKKMISLIDLTIEKLNDLTSLRGLVMAETSELDKNMEDVCYRYFVQNKTDVSDHIFEEVIKSLEKDYLNKLEKSNNCDKKCSHKIRKLIHKENIITNIAFDSSRKARSVKKIIKETNFSLDNYGINEDFYEAYLKEIIETRNLLAHSYSIIKDSGEENLISKKDGKEIVFDKDIIRNIRKRILLYKNILSDLYNKLS